MVAQNIARVPATACLWCGASLTPGRRPQRWCSKRCRQTAWRSRSLAVAPVLDDTSKRLAYADPPYPGCARKYYQHEPSYKGEVNLKKLIARLSTYDGWALSTSRRGLRDVLFLAPRGVIVCPWVKTHAPPLARGPANIHEYLVVLPARCCMPGPPDAYVGAIARQGDSALTGRKPIKFINWMFALVGAAPGDTLDDLYPGSGVVGRCWKELNRLWGIRDANPSVAGGRQTPKRVAGGLGTGASVAGSRPGSVAGGRPTPGSVARRRRTPARLRFDELRQSFDQGEEGKREKNRMPA